MVDFLRDKNIVRLTRLDDGRVMCCICFEYRTPDELHVDETGARWDICQDCNRTEQRLCPAVISTYEVKGRGTVYCVADGDPIYEHSERLRINGQVLRIAGIERQGMHHKPGNTIGLLLVSP